MFLEAHFGDVVRPPPGDEDELTMKVTVDGKVAIVDLISMVSERMSKLIVRKWSQRITTWRQE